MTEKFIIAVPPGGNVLVPPQVIDVDVLVEVKLPLPEKEHGVRGCVDAIEEYAEAVSLIVRFVTLLAP